MPSKLPKEVFGYQVRKPYPSEVEYFKANPVVGGMASDDGKIVFNPYAKGVDFGAIGQNEAARLFLRERKIPLLFDITPQQRQRFVGTPYEGNDDALRETIVGRILSGDPSAGDATDEQQAFADFLLHVLKSRSTGNVEREKQSLDKIKGRKPQPGDFKRVITNSGGVRG